MHAGRESSERSIPHHAACHRNGETPAATTADPVQSDD
ncbi:hypothetical protein HSB1_09970 [Halogranum salarium B-1]|uniref:Uncharacterized protein n=1 Tax=Halogranum salarium B-1 TaxID=1210908 RepID=J3JGS7_9EURY|nr:hypothetical protein HSB1_09970 [Halogranum salarium B-1]